MKRRNGWSWLLGAILLTASVQVLAVEPIVMAASLSLTGKYAELGRMKERGYRLWEEDVNQRGGIVGRPVKLVLVDDESKPEVATRLYADFIGKQKVDFVLAPYSSEITQAVASVTEEHRYPMLASGGSATSLWQQNRKYLFGVYVTTDRYTIGFLELLVRNGISSLAIAAADEPFAKGVVIGTTEWANRFGLKIVQVNSFTSGSTDIEAAIRAAQSSGAQALLVAGHFKDSVQATQALKSIGWKPKAFFATVGPALDNFGEMMGADADYIFSSSQWEPTLSYPGSRNFAQAFVKRYKTIPSYHAATAYAAGEILEAAINKAKTTDRQKIRESLLSLDVITVIGRYGVDKDGRQIRHFTTTVQWQNGKKQIVAPKELKTASPVWR